MHLLREQLNEATKALKDVKKEKEMIESKAAKLVCVPLFYGSCVYTNK